MARIVRAADLPQHYPVPAITPGVLAIFDGIRDGIRDGSETDDERLKKGFVVCDALYAYCRHIREAQPSCRPIRTHPCGLRRAVELARPLFVL